MDKQQVIIIGSGVAGLTAAVYLARAGFAPLVITGSTVGGQISAAQHVRNWPGILDTTGGNLSQSLYEHADSLGAVFLDERVISVTAKTRKLSVTLSSGLKIESRSLIVALGAGHRRLRCKGADLYWQKGVFVCDNPPSFADYTDKHVVIVGGGNSAVTYAHKAAQFAKEVTILQLLDQLTATDPAAKEIMNNDKISILYNQEVTQIMGDRSTVTEVVMQNTRTKALHAVPADVVFTAIGQEPNTTLFKGQLDMTKNGYIMRDANRTLTSVDGVFAAGDVMDPLYRQAITASAFGAMAALDCEYFLTGKVSIQYS